MNIGYQEESPRRKETHLERWGVECQLAHKHDLREDVPACTLLTNLLKLQAWPPAVSSWGAEQGKGREPGDGCAPPLLVKTEGIFCRSVTRGQLRKDEVRREAVQWRTGQ